MSSDRVLEYFDQRRREIQADLETFLGSTSESLAGVSPLGPEACRILATFAGTGKMIRGGLVCYAASLGPGDPTVAIRVGVAMELFQSALLIHDDIMDRDTQRRGQPSVHHLYTRNAERDGLGDAAHLGEALGICVGDIAFFLAFQALAQTALEPGARARLVGLFARELSLVGVAQMMDMRAGASSQDPSTDEVMRLYLYKTGRYTFSLPLRAGALVSGLSESAVSGLDAFGEILGMLFQVKDDEIGLYGDPRDTGKPAGSDIREGKKTIYHAHLVRAAPPSELDRIRRAWGGGGGDEEVRWLLDLIERCGARAEVDRLIQDLADRARGRAAQDPFLADLLTYSLERSR